MRDADQNQMRMSPLLQIRTMEKKKEIMCNCSITAVTTSAAQIVMVQPEQHAQVKLNNITWQYKTNSLIRKEGKHEQKI